MDNDLVVGLAFAMDKLNKSKQIAPRYACGKECLCQTCKYSKGYEFGKYKDNNSCWCHRLIVNDGKYFDDITPCKNGGFKECSYYEKN